jgi:hypothetical protein
MVERLLFNRIDAKARGSAPGSENDFSIFCGTNETKAALSFL